LTNTLDTKGTPENTMRLYLLELTPLDCLSDLSTPPMPGDIVAYMRAGQDPGEVHLRALEQQGIRVISTETLLSMEDARAIHQMGEKFINGWYLNSDGTDTSLYRGVSIGELVAAEIIFQTCPAMFYRIGEICRRLVADFPEASEFLSDLTDGVSFPLSAPIGSLVRETVSQSGVSYKYLKPIKPLQPSVPLNGSYVNPCAMAKQFIGGLRPTFIWQRFKIRLMQLFGKPKKPIYIFMGHGIDKLVRKICAKGVYQVFINHSGFPGTHVLRHDQLFALPSLPSLRSGRSLMRTLRDLESSPPSQNGMFAFRGVDHGPLLAGSVFRKLRFSMPVYMIVMAQAIKMQKIGGFEGIITNGEGMTGMRVLARLQHNTHVQVYYMRHGLNVHRALARGLGMNNSHVTYIASGEDHVNEYGIHLPDEEKPRIVAIGSPMTTTMNPLVGHCSKKHRKRLLIIGYCNAFTVATGRTHVGDRYFLDCLEVVQQLVAEGWSISYRVHPGFNTKLEERLIKKMDLSGMMTIDKSATFSDALLQCDVVIAALSSTYYQSLYAGWPTVFHEPLYDTKDPKEFLDELYTGVLAANDLERPITRDIDTLIDAVSSSLDPDSLISRFPKLFNTSYKRRFIGDEPERADELIADFIIEDMATGNPALPIRSSAQKKH
jgi:hypothetical protein